MARKEALESREAGLELQVNQQIDQKVHQKRQQLRAAVNRRHESAKEDFWRSGLPVSSKIELEGGLQWFFSSKNRPVELENRWVFYRK